MKATVTKIEFHMSRNLNICAIILSDEEKDEDEKKKTQRK